MRAARSLAAVSPSSGSGRVSVAVTIAPCLAQKSEVARPVRARPITKTFFPVSSNISLPQFQSRQSKQRKNQGGDPEANNDFRFAPAEQLKMMVNRRHAEDAFTAQLERADLQNHA